MDPVNNDVQSNPYTDTYTGRTLFRAPHSLLCKDTYMYTIPTKQSQCLAHHITIFAPTSGLTKDERG